MSNPTSSDPPVSAREISPREFREYVREHGHLPTPGDRSPGPEQTPDESED